MTIFTAYEDIALDLGVSLQKASYLTSLQIAVLGGAPLFWRLLSNRYGRRPIFLPSTILSLVCDVGCAKSSTYAFMAACRALWHFSYHRLLLLVVLWWQGVSSRRTEAATCYLDVDGYIWCSSWFVPPFLEVRTWCGHTDRINCRALDIRICNEPRQLSLDLLGPCHHEWYSVHLRAVGGVPTLFTHCDQ